jgi:hypothetical protein
MSQVSTQNWVALCDFVRHIYKLCLSLENRKPNRYMKISEGKKKDLTLEYIIERERGSQPKVLLQQKFKKTFFQSLLLRILQFY